MKRPETLILLLLLISMVPLSLSLANIAEASGPYLVWVRDYSYTPLLDSNPHGRLNLIVSIYKLLNDGVPTYDWYFYEVRIQTVPGRVAYNSNWETAHTYATHCVANPGTNRWLVDYDPTTTSGVTTVTVSLTAAAGPQGSGVAFSVSWSYDIPHVRVIDRSDFSVHRAEWEHDFDETNDPFPGSPSDSTYLAKPGFVVKTTQNAWSFVDGRYGVMWGRPVLWWWEYVTFRSGWLRLDALRLGDS